MNGECHWFKDSPILFLKYKSTNKDYHKEWGRRKTLRPHFLFSFYSITHYIYAYARMRPFHKNPLHHYRLHSQYTYSFATTTFLIHNKKSECHSGEILPYSVNGNKTLTTRIRPTYTIQHSENKQHTKILCKVKTSQGKINEIRENMQGNKTT